MHERIFYTIRLPHMARVANEKLQDAEALAVADHASVEFPSNVRYVGPGSTASDKAAAEAFARYCWREGRLDGTLFHHGEKFDGDTAKDRVLLITDSEVWDGCHCAAVGAVCFRWRRWKDHPDGYALAWAWLHPYFRRRGLLSGLWPYLRARFGDFAVEGPYSSAMVAFLKKIGYDEPGFVRCYGRSGDTAPRAAAVRAFYAAVNARAEADMLRGAPITGAHHRALEELIKEYALVEDEGGA